MTRRRMRSRAEFTDMVERLKAAIARGDVRPDPGEMRALNIVARTYFSLPAPFRTRQRRAS
jgi:hypothetical protein